MGRHKDRICPRNVIIYIIYHLDVLLYQVISTLPFTIYLNVICFSSCHKLIQEMNLHSLTCRFVDWSCERIIIVTACSSYSRSVVLHIKTGKPIKFYHTIHDLYKPDRSQIPYRCAIDSGPAKRKMPSLVVNCCKLFVVITLIVWGIFWLYDPRFICLPWKSKVRPMGHNGEQVGKMWIGGGSPCVKSFWILTILKNVLLKNSQ